MQVRRRSWSSPSAPGLGFRPGSQGRCPQPGRRLQAWGGGARGPTWRVERGQLAGPGVLRAPAPAVGRLVLVELRLLALLVPGARHSHSPSPPGALCWRRRGRGTAARSRRPMTAQRRARRRRGRGLRRAARHSQSGPAPRPRRPIGDRRAAANLGAGGGAAAGRSWARKRRAAARPRLPCSASGRLRPIGSSGTSPPTSAWADGSLQWAETRPRDPHFFRTHR